MLYKLPVKRLLLGRFILVMKKLHDEQWNHVEIKKNVLYNKFCVFVEALHTGGYSTVLELQPEVFLSVLK